MRSLIDDTRHALRLYRRTPAASLIAVIMLAVGIAFVSSFISLYVNLVHRPLPGIEGERLVTIAQVNDSQTNSVPFRLIDRISEEVSALESLVGVSISILASAGDDLVLETVSEGFFDVVRPRVALGRSFDAVEHRFDAAPVVVISDRYWRTQLEGDSDVIGTLIELNWSQGEDEDPTGFSVIGVMDEQVRGVMNDDVDIWLPIERYQAFRGAESPANLAEAYVYGIGRLRPRASARALLNEIESRFPVPEVADEFNLSQGFRMSAASGIVRDVQSLQAAQAQLKLFLGGSLLLALVAAANVSLFLLARAPGRRRELAVRVAFGAPTKRLLGQLATEAGLLVTVSALLGMIASVWLNNLLQGLPFFRQTQWENVSLLDGRVLALVGGIVLILTVLVSLAPIAGLRRVGIARASQHISARASRAQLIAGSAQIAIAGALGGVAIAFAWYLGSMFLVYPGYATEGRYYALFFTPNAFSGGETTSAIDAIRNRELIEAIPGVNGITLSFVVPANTLLSRRSIRDPIDPSKETGVAYGRVDSRFVEVLGLRLLFGRAPREGEAGVSMVNAAFAERFFGRPNIVGERIQASAIQGVSGDVERNTEIIGVLEDVPLEHPASTAEPLLLTSLPPPPRLNLIIGMIDSGLPANELQQELVGLHDSGKLEIQTNMVLPLAEFRERQLAPDTARGLLTIVTAGLVVAMAAFGFYGTQHYLVAAGRREYAIRASLGAGPRALGRLVFARGIVMCLPGLVLGGLFAFIAVGLIRDEYLTRDILPGLVTLAVVAGLTALLLLANLGPARDARRTQPAPLLKED